MENAEIIETLSDAIKAYAQGDSPGGGTIVINLARALAQNGASEEAGKKSARETRKAQTRRIFAYWQQRCDHPRAKLTADRMSKVLARLRDGYTQADIFTAIDGAAEHAFVNSDTGQRYDDLSLICRDGAKLEGFIQRGQAANGGQSAHVDTDGEGGGVELQIQDVRRRMAAAYKADDTKTYRELESKLTELMGKRQ